VPPLPSRLLLPSGLVVRLSRPAMERAPVSNAVVGTCLQALAILAAPNVVTTDDGKPVDIFGLSVRDFHVLRAFLGHSGFVPDEPIELPCENCDQPFQVKASSLFEVGPFVDRELDDPDLDAPFAFDKAHSIPTLLTKRERVRTVRLAPRTVEEVLPLWQAENAEEVRLTPAIAIAMGIVALGNQRRARLIADALMEAPPETFRAIADLVYQAHYSPRLLGAYKCTACGARNDVEVLPVREIPYDTSESRRRKKRHFPDVETFERLVRDAGKRIYRQHAVRNIDLIVDDGVPACDDGGEPLLGCYTPSNVDELTGQDRGPEIRLFYRTFQAAFQDEPSFDLLAEIDETIDHEVTHHLHFLAGDDPLDDEEREAIVKENVRRVGKRETARRASKMLVDDVTGFFRTAWPLLLVAFIATWLGFFRCR
jgi:predicted Zn-dependent protease with MMP-like domain